MPMASFGPRLPLVLALALLLLVAGVGPVEAQAPSPRHMLQLRNTRWDGIRLEVRVGPSQDCEDNSDQGVRVLRREAGWAVVTDEVICWRRELTPGDPGTAWSPWAQVRLAPDEMRDVTF